MTMKFFIAKTYKNIIRTQKTFSIKEKIKFSFTEKISLVRKILILHLKTHTRNNLFEIKIKLKLACTSLALKTTKVFFG